MPNDAKFKLDDFTAELLQIITPRLPRSVKSVPYEWAPLERVMTVAWELPKHKRDAVDSPPRPLKILLMGGSRLVGTNCQEMLVELTLSGPIRLPK